MLSQFTREHESHITLADLNFSFPTDVYPIGRLDADSEGLLLLSNDTRLNSKLLDPKSKMKKTYWVQVEGIPTMEDLAPLSNGIELRIKKKTFKTLPAIVFLLDIEPKLPDRNPPIRKRKNIPDSWLSISILEGKNRQVRKMFAAIGFPVLRLVRVGIADFIYGKGLLDDMNSGDVIKTNINLQEDYFEFQTRFCLLQTNI